MYSLSFRIKETKNFKIKPKKNQNQKSVLELGKVIELTINLARR